FFPEPEPHDYQRLRLRLKSAALPAPAPGSGSGSSSLIQGSKMPRPSPRQKVVSPEPKPQSPPQLSEESTEAPIVNVEGPPPILEEQARKVKRPMPASVKLRYVNRPMPLTARKKLYRQLGICSTYGKPRRTTNSQRNNRKRELTRLLMDECKELKTQGFDPRSRRLKPRRRKGLVESKENECQTRGEEPPGPTEKEEPSHVVRKRRAPFGLEWAQEEASQVASRELRSLLKDECKELKRNLSPGATKSKYSTSVNVAALGPVSPKRLSLMSPSQRQLLSLALDADTTAATGAPGSAENMEEPLMTTDLDPSTMCCWYLSVMPVEGDDVSVGVFGEGGLSDAALAALQDFSREKANLEAEDFLRMMGQELGFEVENGETESVGMPEENWEEEYNSLTLSMTSCASCYAAFLLEFDKRFEHMVASGHKFHFYDYLNPSLPSNWSQSFEVVVADPPFLSEECLTKVSETVRFMAKDKIILCTGLVMKELAKDLMSLDVLPSFTPQHQRNLGNDFACFTNFLYPELQTFVPEFSEEIVFLRRLFSLLLCSS
ncbi:unnamed protein product, partial [Cyprideis torosa]